MTMAIKYTKIPHGPGWVYCNQGSPCEECWITQVVPDETVKPKRTRKPRAKKSPGGPDSTFDMLMSKPAATSDEVTVTDNDPSFVKSLLHNAAIDIVNNGQKKR